MSAPQRFVTHVRAVVVTSALIPCLVVLGIVVLPAQIATAMTATVTTCDGSGPGSLPTVVAGASAGDTITFSVDCPSGSPITLSSTIDIDINLTIEGPTTTAVAISGVNAVQVFDVSPGVTVTISNLTIENGEGGFGGGIENDGTLTVIDSTFSADSASDGGAIGNNNSGTLTVVNSTLSGDAATNGGGAIFNGADEVEGGFVNLLSSTFSGDSASADGGGALDNISSGVAGTITVAGTVFANSPSGGDCAGPIMDEGYNMADDNSCRLTASTSQSDTNPYLGPLQDNGGPTETMAPAYPSAGLDRIPVGTTIDGITLCPGTDQRGVPRPQGPECDMGAVELVAVNGIDSPTAVTEAVKTPFTFTITTAGSPVPTISESGTLPKGVRFKAGTNGTATLSGTPTKTGVAHLTIVTKFPGAAKYTVSEVLTLTVVSS